MSVVLADMAMQYAMSCCACTPSTIVNYSFPRYDTHSWKEPTELRMNY